MSLINPEIENFYNSASEETRLDSGMGMFEFERIKQLIQRYSPKELHTIVDVGGGTGKYSEWLANMGHRVHMVEPVEKHLKGAEARNKKLKNKFEVIKGEAQNLPFPDRMADVVIMHGPLYHLQDRSDRVESLVEAYRILKPGGLLFGFAINASASTVVGLLQGMIHKKPFFHMCKAELTTGMHHPPEEYPYLLAEAFFHKPDQLKEEFADSGFQVKELHAIEGMVWLDSEFFASISNPSKKANLLEILDITDRDPHFLGFSPHLMLLGQK